MFCKEENIGDHPQYIAINISMYNANCKTFGSLQKYYVKKIKTQNIHLYSNLQFIQFLLLLKADTSFNGMTLGNSNDFRKFKHLSNDFKNAISQSIFSH